MPKIGADTAIEAAVHEAGHAVSGMRTGAVLTAIQIHGESGGWLGECKFDKGKVTAENYAANAIAGCLAQAKIRAQAQFGENLSFDKNADLTDFITLIRDSNRDTEDTDPGSCKIYFHVNGNRVEVLLEGRWFSGVDAAQYRMARKAISPPFPGNYIDTQIIQSVMDDLDNPENWDAIQRIATALCDTLSSDSSQASLRGEDARSFL